MKKENKFTGIKRVNVNKKLYNVAFVDGKQKAKVRWSTKNIFTEDGDAKSLTKEKAVQIFKENKTFQPNIKKTTMVNVVETQDLRKRPRIPTRKKFFVQLEGSIKVNNQRTRIVARSNFAFHGHNLEKARRDAEESFFQRLSQASGFSYDVDKGEKLFKSFNGKTKESIIYYNER